MNGGTGSKSISGKFEASVQAPNDIKKPGYNIARWNPWEPELPDTFLVEDDGKTYKVMWAPGLVEYTIRHLWQNIDDNDYTVHEEVKNLYGETEQKTKAEPKLYEGFTIVTPIQQETIKGDGSTVVEIKYNRNIISLTLNFDDGKIEPPLLNNKISGRFGANVPKPNNPTRDCYGFEEWNPKIPDTFPAKDMSYTAGWKIGEAISVELWDGKTLDAIKIPAATMSGKPHDEALYGPLPEDKDEPWKNKGVCGFDEGNKKSFSKFVISKTEVPYWLWYDVRVWAEEQGYEFTNKGREGRDGEVGAKPTANKNQPVTDISWRECIVWCNAFTEKMKGNRNNGVYLTKLYGTSGYPIRSTERTYQGQNECDIAKFEKSRKGFRLPTEVEWEYSARVAKDGTLCPLNYLSGASANYTDDEACKKVAWYNANTDKKIHPVGEKAPNDLGLYDMSGNVSEWCWDQLFGKRVVRGGSHIDEADRCTVGYRTSYQAYSYGIDSGFRLAWSE